MRFDIRKVQDNLVRLIGKIFLIVLFMIELASCSGLQTRPDSEQIWRYGNFCGKDHPKIDSRLTLREQVAALMRITPIDDVDRACMWHDICYTVAEGPTQICDKALYANLKAMKPNIPVATADYSGFFKSSNGDVLDGCRKLIFEVSHFAIAASGLNSDDPWEKTVTGVFTAIAAVVNTPASLIGGGFAMQGGKLAVGPQGVRCIASVEPKFIAPISQDEVIYLKGCYDINQEFRKCKRIPFRRRDGRKS